LEATIASSVGSTCVNLFPSMRWHDSPSMTLMMLLRLYLICTRRSSHLLGIAIHLESTTLRSVTSTPTRRGAQMLGLRSSPFPCLSVITPFDASSLFLRISNETGPISEIRRYLIPRCSIRTKVQGTDSTYEFSILRPSPSLHSVALPEPASDSFDTSFLGLRIQFYQRGLVHSGQ
jgi:hypothetical protein